MDHLFIKSGAAVSSKFTFCNVFIVNYQITQKVTANTEKATTSTQIPIGACEGKF